MESLFFAMLNTPEIILLLVLALILFGAKKLPELAKGLGHGIKEFRKASREISDELNSAIHEEPPPPPRAKPVANPAPAPPEKTEPQADDTSSEGTNTDEPAPAASAPEAESDKAPPLPKP